jgi:hypothetical protein
MKYVRVLGFLLVLSLTTSTSFASTIFLTSGDGTQLARIDTTTAAGTVIGPAGASGAYAAAFNPAGALYGMLNWQTASNRLGLYNQTTGQITAVGGTFGVASMLALEIAADGSMYAGSWGATNNFFSINPATGAATVIGSTGFDLMMDFAFDSAGRLWAIENSNGSNNLWTINLTTGVGTHVTGVTGAFGLIMSIMFDADGTLYATDYISNSHLYRVNTVTGVATDLGATGLSFAHGGDIAAVPEPASMLLLASGLVAGVARYRRRR